MVEAPCKHLDVPLRKLLEVNKGIEPSDQICFWYALALMDSPNSNRSSFLCTNKGIRSTCKVAKQFDEALHGKK